MYIYVTSYVYIDWGAVSLQKLNNIVHGERLQISHCKSSKMGSPFGEKG